MQVQFSEQRSHHCCCCCYTVALPIAKSCRDLSIQPHSRWPSESYTGLPCRKVEYSWCSALWSIGNNPGPTVLQCGLVHYSALQYIAHYSEEKKVDLLHWEADRGADRIIINFLHLTIIIHLCLDLLNLKFCCICWLGQSYFTVRDPNVCSYLTFDSWLQRGRVAQSN